MLIPEPDGAIPMCETVPEWKVAFKSGNWDAELTVSNREVHFVQNKRQTSLRSGCVVLTEIGKQLL